MDEIKEFILESNNNEFIGIKAGQDYYKSIYKDLSSGLNRIVIPEDAEITSSWFRGFNGQRQDDLYIYFVSDNPELNEFASRWHKTFQCIRGDKDAIDFAPSKKKKK